MSDIMSVLASSYATAPLSSTSNKPYTAVDPKGIITVRWTDMRFAGGTLALDQQGPRTNPFTATVRLGADGKVTEQFLGAKR